MRIRENVGNENWARACYPPPIRGGLCVVELCCGAGARIVLVRQTRPAENGRGRGSQKLPR